MNLLERTWLFLKGVCMGSADVIPGVSGGTMALILGIYKRLVDAIRGLHLRWVPPLWRWVTDGRQLEDWRAFADELGTMDLGFLAVLGAGIVAAIVGGSLVIPGLMASHPVAMRAFFFGLIAASVWVPWKMIEVESGRGIAAAVAVGIVALSLGYWVTAPGAKIDATQQWTTVVSSGETLETLARRGPSAAPSHEIYRASRNEPLRRAVRRASPDRAAALREAGADTSDATSKEAIEEMSRPYRDVTVPAGTAVDVPRPAAWFVFGSGAVAICAMILPGISGSYILLILGMYFFVLNAIKGTIAVAVGGSLPLVQSGYAGLFGVGAVVGLLSFARLLSWLLETYPTPTLAGLVGLMIGCLRGIWPFRGGGERAVNVIPDAFGAEVTTALLAASVGGALVAVLTRVGDRSIESADGADAT